jgi:uncharacterized RDD family membrane protein YckC
MYKFLKKQQINNENYANPSKRFIAYAIDNFIVTIARYLVLLSCYSLWFRKRLLIFMQNYQETIIGKELNLSLNSNLFRYFLNDPIFTEFLFIILLSFVIGSLYWIILPVKFAGTLGKKLCKIKIVTVNNKDIDIKLALYRYFIALIPWGFHFIVIIALSAKNIPLMIAAILIISFWYEINLFGRSYRAMHDVICETKVIKLNN